MRSTTIREREAYAGARPKMIARLSTAQLPVQVDVGFGDAVTPAPERVTLETILDFPAPVLRAYPMPMVLAEKVHAMVSLVFRNSRMTDLLDPRCERNLSARSVGPSSRHFFIATEDFGWLPDIGTRIAAQRCRNCPITSLYIAFQR